MKTLSIIIIFITLGIFYTLAIDQQNKLEKDQQTDPVETSMIHESYISPYIQVEEDFSMHVTGKEHRYLNTGISFIEFGNETVENHVMIVQTDDVESNLSGS